MKLTIKEIVEQEVLTEKQKSSRIPMIQKDFDRLKYLFNKEFHNNCSNPRCLSSKDYEENELICPLCGNKIFKLICK